MNWFKCLLIFYGLMLWSPASDASDPLPRNGVAENIADRLTLTPAERAWLEQAPVIRFRVAENPPEQFFENGVVVGLSVDYAKIICANLKLQCVFTPYLGGPFAEALQKIGKADGPDIVLTGRRSPEREALALFTEPYLFTPSVILTRQTAPNIFSLAELSGKKILIERGYVIAKLIQENVPSVEFITVNTTAQALESLAGGIGDAYVGNLTTSTFLAAKLNLANLKVAAPTNFPIQGESMMVRNDWPELVAMIDKVLDAITPGEKQQLRNYWYSLHYGDRHWRFIGISLSIAAALLALALLTFFYRNRQLRIQAQKTSNQMKRLEDTLPGALYEYAIGNDGVGEFIYFSESIYFVTGFRAQDLIGRDQLLTHRIHLEDLPKFLVSIKSARRTGNPFFVELRFQVADGSWKWLQMNAAAQGEDFMTTTWSGLIFDITDRKHLENLANRSVLIEQEYAAVKHLLQEKDYLVASMLHDNRNIVANALSASIAHELNQPLGASSLNIQFLKRQLDRDELSASVSREILNNLDEDNQRAASFVQTLRSIFLDSNATSTVLDLNEQIQEALSIVRPVILNANITLDLQFSPGLLIAIPKNDLQKVLLNLMTNAVEAFNIESSPAYASRSNIITISTTRSFDSVLLSISDNGRGIPSENIPSLFDLLANDQEKVTGLGLWLCQHIIHRYGGRIWYEQPGSVGCRFIVELPFCSESTSLQ